MVFATEAINKELRKYAKSGKNIAEESVERTIKNNIQESSETAINRLSDYRKVGILSS